MSETALATLDTLPDVSKYGPNDANQDQFTKGLVFLPRIEFKSDQATIVKKRQFPANHYMLTVNKDTKIDLGETFTAIPLAYRYKALDFREKGRVKQSYDPNSAEFLAIRAEADKKRAPGEMSGCMYGAEFLLAVKLPDGTVALATLLCSSTSLKATAKKLFGLVRKFITFGSKLIDGKYTYTAPEVSTFSGTFELGDMAKIVKEINEFNAASGVIVTKPEDEDEDDSVAPPADGARAR